MKGNKLAVNFEKHNSKTQLKWIKEKEKRVIIQEKKWIAYVYRFPKDFPISIEQKSRNFHFVY
jgi:hypothetical protein